MRNDQLISIKSSKQAFHELRPFFDRDVEELWALALNSKKQMISIERIFRGTVDACFFHPRDIFRFAIKNNASTIIVAHNHPSNDPTPSEADIFLTKQLVLAGELLQIPVIDHLVITQSRHISLVQKLSVPSK